MFEWSTLFVRHFKCFHLFIFRGIEKIIKLCAFLFNITIVKRALKRWKMGRQSRQASVDENESWVNGKILSLWKLEEFWNAITFELLVELFIKHVIMFCRRKVEEKWEWHASKLKSEMECKWNWKTFYKLL